MQITYPPNVSRPYLYLPDGWDSIWKAAKATAPSSPAAVFFDGDSIACGSYVAWGQSYVELVASSLASSLGRYGDYWSASLNTSTTVDSGCPWSYASVSSLPVWDDSTNSSSTAASAVQTFTTPYACTGFDVYYHNPSGFPGTWQYSVDGAANVTVTNTADNKITKLSFTGLSSGIHTVAYGWQSVNYVASMLGISVTAPGATGGVRFARHAKVGHNAEGFAANTAVPGVTGWTGWPVSAHLCVFDDSANDVSAATSLTTFGAAIDAKVRALRRQTKDCSILYIVTSIPASPPDDYNAGWTGASTAWQYHTQIHQLAKHHNFAVLDVHAKWGASGLSSMFANTVHPSVAGHADIANSLLAIL